MLQVILLGDGSETRLSVPIVKERAKIVVTGSAASAPGVRDPGGSRQTSLMIARSEEVFMRKGGSEFTKKGGQRHVQGGVFRSNGEVKDGKAYRRYWDEFPDGRLTARTIKVYDPKRDRIEVAQLNVESLRYAMEGRAMKRVRKITGGNRTRHILMR